MRAYILDMCGPGNQTHYHGVTSTMLYQLSYRGLTSSPLISVCLCAFSPGRSPISFDHEVVMMNHVYKERFPKVPTDQDKLFIHLFIMTYLTSIHSEMKYL